MDDKKNKTSLGPRVRESVREFYSSMFENQTAGAEFGLEVFRAIIRRSLAELTGTFTQNELCLITDVVNGLILASEPFGQHLTTEVAEAIQFDSMAEKWSVNGQELIAKLGTLTTIQIGALGIWTKAFWVQAAKREKNTGSKSISLQQYVAPLVAREASK